MSDERTPFREFPFGLRRLRETDLPHVMVIERRVFSLPWSQGIFRYEIRHNPFGYYLGIESVDARLPPIVGYGGVWLYLPEAHISTIAVHPDFQGLHFGAWLLAALLAHAARQGAREATLEVRVSNTKAQRLYTSFGFAIVGRRTRYYSDNGEDAYIMTLRPLRLSAIKARLEREATEARRRWAEKGAHIVARFQERRPAAE